ncbi:hypothetical protein WHJ47_14400, partial [Staphylococcus aureus]|uniref:hypothetical protein n=1 Tax=Staphylococcus aureus TaxID=1280 RepID=UPI0039BE0C58
MATTKQRGAKAKTPRDRSGVLYAIVGDDVLQGLDGVLARINAQVRGPKWSRQDLARVLLTERLAA